MNDYRVSREKRSAVLEPQGSEAHLMDDWIQQKPDNYVWHRINRLWLRIDWWHVLALLSMIASATITIVVAYWLLSIIGILR